MPFSSLVMTKVGSEGSAAAWGRADDDEGASLMTTSPDAAAAAAADDDGAWGAAGADACKMVRGAFVGNLAREACTLLAMPSMVTLPAAASSALAKAL